MNAKQRILLVAIFSIGFAFAISSSELSANIDNLVTKMNQVNYDLNKKQKQQQDLDNAIGDSGNAIDQAKQLLNDLQHKRSLDLVQLNQIAIILPQITSATMVAESRVEVALSRIYQQIKVVENNSNSIISGNDYLQNERKKVYLLQLLKLEKNKYLVLREKLSQLNALNSKLQQELARLNEQLTVVAKKQQQLELLQGAKMKQAKSLQEQIAVETIQLNNLKQTQKELNHLLAKLTKSEANKSIRPRGADKSYEDNSPFLKRKLARPVDGTVAVNFGTIKNGVANHGILFTATNSEVYAISKGVVVYSGKLPGFGQILVVNNGDNYVSIYGGIVPMVNKGQQVVSGQVIAGSGTTTNQPMGGVYFELRHLGKPVNPTALVN